MLTGLVAATFLGTLLGWLSIFLPSTFRQTMATWLFFTVVNSIGIGVFIVSITIEGWAGAKPQIMGLIINTIQIVIMTFSIYHMSVRADEKTISYRRGV